MKHTSKSLFIVLAIALMAFFAKPALAQNDQTFVIGLGVGIHTFSKTDEMRQTFVLAGDYGGLGQFWGEWYLLDYLGIGIKNMGINTGEKAISGGDSFEREVDVDTNLITVQFLPYISSDDYTRIGIYGGVGSSTYEYKETLILSGITYSASVSSSGPAINYGAFVDWGAEDFGARFGYGFLNTTLDDLDTGGQKWAVDGSGSHWYFDLRWAFE